MTAEIIQKELISISNTYESFFKTNQENIDLAKSLGFINSFNNSLPSLKDLKGKVVPNSVLKLICKKYDLAYDRIQNYIGDIPRYNLEVLKSNLDKFSEKKGEFRLMMKNGSYFQHYYALENNGFYILKSNMSIICKKVNFIDEMMNSIGISSNDYQESPEIIQQEQVVRDSDSEDPIVFSELYTMDDRLIDKGMRFNTLQKIHELNLTGYSLIHTMWGAEQVLPEIAEFYKQDN